MREPFLMNPHLGIINPRKKGKKTMAKRNSKAHMAYVRSFRKNAKRKTTRRKARKSNPWPVAGMVVANPRRRKHAKRRNAVVRHRRRSTHYSRNPKIMGIELPPFNKVLFAGVGFVVPPMVEGVISGFIPAEITSNTIGKYAVRIASVLALAFGIRRFIGREEGNMAAIGGGVYVLSTAAMEFAPNLFGAAPHPASVSAYVPARQQLSAYVAANQPIMRQLGANSAYSDDAYSGAVGGTAVRFKR